ncbi:uncharacterized protein NECHADRAFT_79629 [Fusarium vanettenii 77-13-4]|uniref:Uncharacterized protein n=1 Tax=Fusarium vanettenii (strain ATCC MYA-4622 / CBS 123669 / FGSC 9596 / NRRL 45880 / 77-13-4) TaxID=660122 RepID=C7Z814_FUSV7|nr:uncharacterized protein NECHADRAFT_79629 [Fusarium vanettenii 77-13-4]EEU39786.1 predicted protein [Fusarium vanettenii 77-13-4]
MITFNLPANQLKKRRVHRRHNVKENRQKEEVEQENDAQRLDKRPPTPSPSSPSGGILPLAEAKGKLQTLKVNRPRWCLLRTLSKISKFLKCSKKLRAWLNRSKDSGPHSARMQDPTSVCCFGGNADKFRFPNLTPQTHRGCNGRQHAEELLDVTVSAALSDCAAFGYRERKVVEGKTVRVVAMVTLDGRGKES